MSHPKSIPAFFLIGGIAFLVAVLSIVDMFVPRPFDGVVLDPDRLNECLVFDVVPGSGAQQAGIAPGDRILGIGNNILTHCLDAEDRLAHFAGGDTVAYFVSRPALGSHTYQVTLGQRRYGTPPYGLACLLGFAFFFIGLFVLVRQPQQRASRVFFLLCSLFLVFLVCRLRPASYSQVDTLVLATGTAALVFLPASFLHFFLIFPRVLPHLEHWLHPSGRRLWWRFLSAIYLVPVLVLGASLLISRLRAEPLPLISGAPVANWWVLAAYMLLGLGALAANFRNLPDPRERRGAALVFFGALFGLIPFLVLAVAFPSHLRAEGFLFYGVAPLALVPLTFAYAIVRFQILDIRIILRKGLLYTATTAVITGLYALGIASFNTWFTGTSLAASRFFPLVFALAIVLLFEPLRQRIQGPVDRFFFGEQTRLQQAMVQLGETLNAQIDLELVVQDLVEELPRLLGLHFAALYLRRGDRLERTAGPETLPLELPESLASLVGGRKRRVQQIESLPVLAIRAHRLGRILKTLESRDVEMIADLSSPRRPLGLVLLSRKNHQMAYEPEEVELLGSLLSQAAVALENSLLLQERTQEAELSRELAIASSIQASLLPKEVSLGEDWEVAALCRPAKDVGGDFFAQLPGENPGRNALIYGDVSGKSVSGALVMMAAHEVFHALALTHPQPQKLLDLANRRLYQLGNRGFVAIGYLAGHRENGSLLYTVAGQPSPLKRSLDGTVGELDPPQHRVPLGALSKGSYEMKSTAVKPGELILAYSDGVVDTRSPDGEFFGEARLHQCLRAAPGAPKETVQYILDSLQTFARGQAPYDDLTLVAVRRHPEALHA